MRYFDLPPEERPRYVSERKPSSCPHCSEPHVARIVYGLIDPCRAEEMQKKGWVGGGCIITGDDPKWKCTSCGADIYDTPESEFPIH